MKYKTATELHRDTFMLLKSWKSFQNGLKLNALITTAISITKRRIKDLNKRTKQETE